MVTRVMGVIPTFRPPASLEVLINNLVNQVDHVIVSDDASPCTSDPILALARDTASTTVIRHDRNAGIARGLNDGLAAAKAASMQWLLTLDQDSHLPEGYVLALTTDARDRQSKGVKVGAIGAEIIHDASGKLSYPLQDTGNGYQTEELIQTGTLWSVAALIDIGGFDESLGIDAVDAAACLRLRERSYAICVSPGTSVTHTIGSARMVRMFGRDVMVTGHSPERRTSIVRHRLRLFPAEFRQSPTHAFRTLRRVAVNQTLGLVLERDRWAKAKGSIRGLVGKDTR